MNHKTEMSHFLIARYTPYGIAAITPRITSWIMMDSSYKISTILVQPWNYAADLPCPSALSPQGIEPAWNIFGDLRGWPKKVIGLCPTSST